MKSKTKIVLVEIDFHNEVVKAIALQLLSQEVDLVIASTDFVFNNLPDLQYDSRLEWKLKLKTQTNFEFLNQVLAEYKDSDFFLFNGFQKIEKSFLNIKFPINSNYILHDLHNFFNPYQNIYFRKSISGKIKDLVKFFIFIATGQKKTNDTFLSKFNKILLPAESVVGYNRKKSFVQKAGLVKFAIHETVINPSSDEVINIVIPGTIIQKSRDYHTVIRAFEIIKKQINQSVKIILLGRAVDNYGRTVIKSFKELTNDLITVQSFESFISQEVFDASLQEAHFLILPTQKYMRFNFCKEINSQSCVSGNVNDMVRYGKPSLLPQFYQLDNALNELTERYAGEGQLSIILIAWINNKQYKYKLDNIEKVMEKELVAPNGKTLIQALFT